MVWKRTGHWRRNKLEYHYPRYALCREVGYRRIAEHRIARRHTLDPCRSEYFNTPRLVLSRKRGFPCKVARETFRHLSDVGRPWIDSSVERSSRPAGTHP